RRWLPRTRWRESTAPSLLSTIRDCVQRPRRTWRRYTRRRAPHRAPRVRHGCCRSCSGPFLMRLTDEEREDGSEQHEDERLHEPNKKVEEETGSPHPPPTPGHPRRGSGSRPAGKDVAEERKPGRQGSEENRADSEPARREKHDDE